jgi:hypothetical protein
MTPEEVKKVQFHTQQIAQILYSNTDPTEIQALAEIETVVRRKILESVSPEIGVFLSKMSLKQKPDDRECSNQRSGRSTSQKNKLEN